jgi:hypothetical protein
MQGKRSARQRFWIIEYNIMYKGTRKVLDDCTICVI